MDSAIAQQTALSAFAQPIEWRTRYGGLVVIACLDQKPVAGISGPWDGKFALTWWDRPLPARQLELYDTLDDAKHEIEEWALRMRDGPALTAPRAVTDTALWQRPLPESGHATSTTASSARHIGLVERMFTLLPAVAKPRESASETIERLRRERSGNDELADLHFTARC